MNFLSRRASIINRAWAANRGAFTLRRVFFLFSFFFIRASSLSSCTASYCVMYFLSALRKARHSIELFALIWKTRTAASLFEIEIETLHWPLQEIKRGPDLALSLSPSPLPLSLSLPSSLSPSLILSFSFSLSLSLYLSSLSFSSLSSSLSFSFSLFLFPLSFTI